MKQRIRKLLYCLIVVSISALSGCEKDLYENTQVNSNTIKTYYITGKQAVDVAGKLGGKLNKTLSSKGTTFKADDGVTIDYSSIMVVENGTAIAYSLKADSNAETDLIFQNVVMEEKDNETVTKLMTYQMTPQFAADYKNGLKGMGQFKGIITITTLTGRDECHATVETVPFDDSGNPANGTPVGQNSSGSGSSASGSGSSSGGGGGTAGQNPYYGYQNYSSTTGGHGSDWVIYSTGGSGSSGSSSSGSSGGNGNGGDLIGVPGGHYPEIGRAHV